MTTVRIVITGEVQNVKFRAFIMQAAHMNDVTGWVRNVGIDMVELLMQGESEEVENVISLCYMGPDASVIETVDVEVEETRSVIEKFEMRASIDTLPS